MTDLPKLRNALAVLKEHNKCRRGDETIPQGDPSVIGDAIDVIVEGVPGVITAFELYRGVAESARDQWGDDYLWDKWGHHEDMAEAEAAIAARGNT